MNCNFQTTIPELETDRALPESIGLMVSQIKDWRLPNHLLLEDLGALERGQINIPQSFLRVPMFCACFTSPKT
jgi:hypothetical protein